MGERVYLRSAYRQVIIIRLGHQFKSPDDDKNTAPPFAADALRKDRETYVYSRNGEYWQKMDKFICM